jgi:ABC-type amino acid transport substrate-binding protein/Zn-dependent protease with chaperone function
MSPEWNGTLYRIVLDSSLRAVLVAAIVALILMTARVRSSGVRHAAWTAVLLAMLLMPVLPYCVPSISIPVPVPAAAIQAKIKIAEAKPAPAAILSSDVVPAPVRGMQHKPSSAPSPERRPMWPLAAIVLYCIGVSVLFSRALLGWRAMSRIARACKPVALDAVIRPELRQVKAPVYESEMVAAPLTAGIISPRIILPVTWRTWSPQKLSAVLAHEFSHVRRRDTLIAPLSHLNRCLFWFHPLAWWLERKLAATAELACDDDAIRTIGETKLYAEVLLDMAQLVHRRGGRLAWQGLGVNGNGFLGQRIDRLLRDDLFCEISRIRKAIVAFGCAAAIFLAVACHQKPRTAAQQENPKLAQQAQQRPSHSLWAKRLRIITYPVNAPLEFGAGTGVQGLDVDIGNEIGKTLGIEVKWVKIHDPGYEQNRLHPVIAALFGRSPGAVSFDNYKHLRELLKKDDVEILISAIAIDRNKSADFEFSTPYYDTGDIIAHQRNRSDITDLASLSGKKVGIAAGRPGDAFMATQKTATGVVITKYSTMDEALVALNIREIDAVVGDEPMITYSSVKSFHNTTTLPILINKYKYAVAVRKGKTELLAKINATIDRLKSAGELKRLDETWLGNVRRDAMDLHQKDLEVERLKKQKSIAFSIPKVSGEVSMSRMD